MIKEHNVYSKYTHLGTEHPQLNELPTRRAQ